MAADGLHYVERRFSGEFSNDEVFAWLDQVLDENKALQARGIKVSVSLYQKGISGDHRSVPIAMDPDLYPVDHVVVIFEAKGKD